MDAIRQRDIAAPKSSAIPKSTTPIPNAERESTASKALSAGGRGGGANCSACISLISLGATAPLDRRGLPCGVEGDVSDGADGGGVGLGNGGGGRLRLGGTCEEPVREAGCGKLGVAAGVAEDGSGGKYSGACGGDEVLDGCRGGGGECGAIGGGTKGCGSNGGNGANGSLTGEEATGSYADAVPPCCAAYTLELGKRRSSCNFERSG